MTRNLRSCTPVGYRSFWLLLLIMTVVGDVTAQVPDTISVYVDLDTDILRVPEHQAEVVGTLPRGAKAQAMGYGKGRWYVRYENIYGYISDRQIRHNTLTERYKKDGPSLPLPPVQLVQLTKNEDGLYEFKKVFEASGSADDLYLRAHQWIVRTYQSANHVIQLEDSEGHVIMAKGHALTTLVLSRVRLWHILQIDTKDGRYRITYNSFTYQDVQKNWRNMPFEEKMPKKVKRKTEEYIEASLIDLIKTMSKGPDDW